MSVGIDLGQLGTPIIMQDEGYSGGQTYNDLADSLSLTQVVRDQGLAGTALFLDLVDTISATLPVYDQGGSWVQQPASDTTVLAPIGTQPQGTTDAYWQMTGYDTATHTTITWTGRTPLAPPPTQDTVTNITATRLTAYNPQTNGQ